MIFALLAFAAASSPPQAWDFEGPESPGLILTAAARKADASLVIDGGGSLLADSRATGVEWNEYVHTDPEIVPLKRDTGYAITLKYRILEPYSQEIFYALIRSETLGKEEGDRGRTWWKAADSDVHQKNLIVRTGPADDYYLILGIRGAGAVFIDALQIREGTPVPEGKVKSRPFAYGDEWRKWQQSGLENGVRQWLEVCQNVLDPGGWRKWDGEFADYLPNLMPDIVAYLNITEVHQLGLPRTTAKTEYQELYLFDAEREGIPFEQFLESFEHDGLSKGLDGERILDDTWAAGGHFTCQQGEHWHRYFQEKLKSAYGEWDGLNQDNIGVVGAFKGKAAFCEGCQARFREYMKSGYSGEELAGMGIPEIDSFNIIDFMLEHALSGREALKSPVIREYIKSYTLGQHEAWRDTAFKLREWTRNNPKPYPIYGNNIGGMGPIPYAVTLCPWVDAVSMEHWWPAAEFYKPPRFHCAAWGYKVAAAASGYRKPVFILNALETEGRPAYKTTTELTFAEGLANGGYRVYSPGLNVPNHQGDYPLDMPEIRALHERYADFIRKNRGLFWGRKSMNRAAVVYSVPTHLFHRFSAIPGLDDIAEYRRFAAACLMMERAHIPYDVLVLPHPELMPDNGWKEQLSQYDLIVCPGVAAISKEQVEALNRFKAGGGRLLMFAPYATHDENYSRYKETPWDNSSGEFTLLLGFDQDVGDTLWDRKESSMSKMIVGELNRVHPPRARTVQADFPDGLVANLWMDEEESFVSLHLVNYGWDPETDSSLEVSDLQVSVSANPVMEKYEPFLLLPEEDEPIALKQARAHGMCVVEIPRLRVYGIVTWGDPEAIEAKTLYADAFQAGMRLAKLSNPGGEGEPLPERWWEALTGAWAEGDVKAVRQLHDRWQLELNRRIARQ